MLLSCRVERFKPVPGPGGIGRQCLELQNQPGSSPPPVPPSALQPPLDTGYSDAFPAMVGPHALQSPGHGGAA